MKMRGLLGISILHFTFCNSMHVPSLIRKEEKREIFAEFENYRYAQAYQLLQKIDPEQHDINCVDRDGDGPLHYYAYQARAFLVPTNNNNEEEGIIPSRFVQLLLQKGIPLESVDRYGHTPFLTAALAGDLYMMWHLITVGADYKAVSVQKQNALHILFTHTHAIARMNKWARTGCQQPWLKEVVTTMGYAKQPPSLKAQCLRSLARCKTEMLQEQWRRLPRELRVSSWRYMVQYASTFFPSYWNNLGYDSSFYAEVAQEVKQPLSELLSAKDMYGNTPLHYALRNHAHPRLIQFLIHIGADRLMRDADNKSLITLLHESCECRFPYTLQQRAELARYLQTAQTIMAFVQRNQRAPQAP